MRVVDNSRQNSSTRWLEGLILMVLLTVLIIISVNSKNSFAVLCDEPVSAWSGTIDNLK